MMKMTKLWKFFLVALLCLLPMTVAPAAELGSIRIGVINFESKTSGVTPEQARMASDVITQVLAQSRTISVLEREQIDRVGAELRIGASGLVSPETAAEIGRLTGVQYMVLGSVTELKKKKNTSSMPIPFFGGLGMNVKSTEWLAEATIYMRLVDVSTGEVVMAISEKGDVTDSQTGFGTDLGALADAIREGKGGSSDGGFEEIAVADAAFKLANKLRAELGGEYSQVIAVSGKSIEINIGASSGIQDGDLFMVYADGSAKHDIDGTLIGREKIPFAVLKARNTQDRFTVCDVVPSGGKAELIMRGDKVEPISAKNAKGLVGKLPKERPRMPRSTYESLLGSNATGNPGTAKMPAKVPAPVPVSNVSVTYEPANAEESAPKYEEPTLPAQQLVEPSQRSATNMGTTPRKSIEGIDPDTTTDAKLINTYPLSPNERNVLGIQHRNAYKLYSQKKFKKALEMFSKLADDYSCNYLSAYWAGMVALKLNDKDEATKWFDRALSINPSYKPAQNGRPSTVSRSISNGGKKESVPVASGEAPLASEENTSQTSSEPTQETSRLAANVVTSSRKSIEGVDPDHTTDAALINTFPLSTGDRNVLGIQHRNAYKLYSRKKYKEALAIFSKLADDYSCNYLSAYWAGMAAMRTKDKDVAAKWFSRALSVNPKYQPAIDAKGKL